MLLKGFSPQSVKLISTNSPRLFALKTTSAYLTFIPACPLSEGAPDPHPVPVLVLDNKLFQEYKKGRVTLCLVPSSASILAGVFLFSRVPSCLSLLFATLTEGTRILHNFGAI